MKNLFTILLSLGFILPVFASHKPVATNLEFDNIKRYATGAAARGRVDAQSGVFRYLYNENADGYNGTAEEIARAYLADNSKMFGIEPTPENLKTFAVKGTPGGFHVYFDQYLKGIPVYNTRVTVSLNKVKNVTFVSNNYRSGLRMNKTNPGVTDAQAIELARNYLNVSGRLIGKQYAELMVFESKDRGAELAWKVIIPAMRPLGDWEVMVNAIDGRISNVRDLAMYDDGQGLVWNPDPLTTAGVEYGGDYVDDNDNDAAVLNAERISVVLRDITFEDGVYKLKGPYAVLFDHEGPTDNFPELTDPNGFNFTRSQQEFEDVNVYYHIDKSTRRLLSLGYSDPAQLEFEADPHGLDGQDNSHYVTSDNYVAFGEGGVDDGEDADIVWHEHAHSFQTNLTGGMSYSGETGSIQEGSSDYWAASYSRITNDYNWGYVFNWDGHNPFWDGRRCDTDMKYPDDYNAWDMHGSGQIWSSALMDIWTDLGRDITDKLFIETHYIWGYNPTFYDAAQAFIQADKNLYDGEHLSVITTHFEFHGLVQSEDYIPTIEHTPLPDTDNTIDSVTVIATITPGPEPLDPNRLWVVYGVSALTDTVTLIATGNPDEYSARIPPLGNDIDIHYYIVAKDTASNTDYHPYDAPSNYHSFHAQARGRIEGNVDLTNSEDDGDVSVTLSGLQTDTTLTASSGNYSFDGLNNGTYSVKVHKDGYTTTDSVISEISVSQDTVNNIDFTLEPIVSALGKGSITSLPEKYALLQNYPNPFNPKTTIRYQLPEAAFVQLAVYNTLGQKVRSLIEKKQSPGSYTVTLHADGLSSGVYFYRIKANNFSGMRKLILVK